MKIVPVGMTGQLHENWDVWFPLLGFKTQYFQKVFIMSLFTLPILFKTQMILLYKNQAVVQFKLKHGNHLTNHFNREQNKTLLGRDKQGRNQEVEAAGLMRGRWRTAIDGW